MKATLSAEINRVGATSADIEEPSGRSGRVGCSDDGACVLFRLHYKEDAGHG